MAYIRVLFLSIFILFSAFNGYTFEADISQDLRLDNKSKVMGATVPTTFMLYSFDADIIAGWNTPLYSHEKRYIPEKYQNLQVLGGWYGNGNYPHKEVLLSNKIDAAFAVAADGSKTKKEINKMKEYMASINIPFVSIQGTTINDDIKIYSLLGKIFNNEKRSEEINKYIIKSIENTKKITDKVQNKKMVYLALGDNGLKTRCVDSLILAGAEYVHKCSVLDETISIEQLIIYNPDVIVIGKKAAYEYIKKDKKWAKIKAVKNNNILFVPEEPFSWVEKKTVMEYFVIQYLASKLYPEYANIDLHKELMEHIKLFFHYDLSYDMAERLINYEKYYK